MKHVKLVGLLVGGGLLVACSHSDPAQRRRSSAALVTRAPTTLVAPPFVIPIASRKQGVDCEGLPPCDGPSARNCCNSSTTSRDAPSSGLSEEVVFEPPTGKGYRIPAFVSIPGGPQLAFAEERDHDLVCHDANGNADIVFDSGNIRVVMRARSSSLEPWGPQQVVCNLPGNTCGNPTPVYDSANDRIVLLVNSNPAHMRNPAKYVDCPRIGEGDRHVHVLFSDKIDGSASSLSFSDPEEISALVQKPKTRWDCAGPGNGFDLGNGRLVFPACDGRNIYHDPSTTPGWSYEVIPHANTSEGAIVATNDGLLMRSDRATGGWLNSNGIFRRRSARQLPSGDWSSWFQDGQPLMPAHKQASCGHYAATCSTNVAQGCQGSIRRFSSGSEIDRLLFSGPASTMHRYGLAVSISYDEGETWTMGREVLGVEDTNTGYSSVDRVGDRVGVLYEHVVDDGVRNDRIYSIRYMEKSLSALVCGRKEPILIGGNRWLGHFEREIIDQSGVHEFWSLAKLGGESVDVFVRSDIESRLAATSATVDVRFSRSQPWQTGTVSRNEPGVIRLFDDTKLDLSDFDEGEAWCARSR